MCLEYRTKMLGTKMLGTKMLAVDKVDNVHHTKNACSTECSFFQIPDFLQQLLNENEVYLMTISMLL